MVAAALLVALIAGCTSAVRPGADSRLQQQARTLEASGNYQGAAQLYLDAAAQTVGPEQQALQLQAAASLIRGEDYAGANRLLDELPAAQLSGEVRQHYVVNRAAIAVVEQRPGQALTLLGEGAGQWTLCSRFPPFAGRGLSAGIAFLSQCAGTCIARPPAF